MITKDFCTTLEMAIRRRLAEYDDKHIKFTTTDDIIVDLTDRTLTRKFVNDNRYAMLRIYALGGPVAVFDLKLQFGNKAASRYARGLDLLPCIPDPLDDNNMVVDVEKKEIVVRLV